MHKTSAYCGLSATRTHIKLKNKTQNPRNRQHSPGHTVTCGAQEQKIRYVVGRPEDDPLRSKHVVSETTHQYHIYTFLCKVAYTASYSKRDAKNKGEMNTLWINLNCSMQQEKLLVAYLLKNFLAVYKTKRFVAKNLTLHPILSHAHPFHNITTHFLNICFNIILTPSSTSLNWPVPSSLQKKSILI